MATKLLSELEPGEKGMIVRVGGTGSIHQRLLDMGVVAGTSVEVVRAAPLGDPIEIKLKGYNLTLRKKEAANIEVELNLKGNLMPLSMASTGEEVKIATVTAGWGLQRRLADMGLTPGAPVRVINSHGRGPVVLEVRGSRLALGHGIAHKIMVTSPDPTER